MGIFNADVIINIPPAFFSLQKSGLVRVYLTSVFLLLSVPRCFGDQKPQFDCGHRYKRGQGFHRGGPPRFHQQAPRSAACHRCGRDDPWARNCILNLQHRDFRHMWRCNICGNEGHGPVRCPFRNGCQQQQNQQQQSLTQQQHQEQPKDPNKQNNLNYIVADLNLFWKKGAAEREDWRGENTENKREEEAVLGETDKR